jgi:hypothetical protein
MAISSSGFGGGYYAANLDMRFDSEAHYRHYMEDMYMRQRYEQARGQQLGGITARDIYNTGSVVKAQVEPTVPEALRFLNKIDNKVLLTGEAS